MSQSIIIHDVSKLTVKRSSDPEQRWTTLVVDHTNWGRGTDDEHKSISSTTEITLHHNDLQKLLVKLQNKRSGA